MRVVEQFRSGGEDFLVISGGEEWEVVDVSAGLIADSAISAGGEIGRKSEEVLWEGPKGDDSDEERAAEVIPLSITDSEIVTLKGIGLIGKEVKLGRIKLR